MAYRPRRPRPILFAADPDPLFHFRHPLWHYQTPLTWFQRGLHEWHLAHPTHRLALYPSAPQYAASLGVASSGLRDAYRPPEATDVWEGVGIRHRDTKVGVLRRVGEHRWQFIHHDPLAQAHLQITEPVSLTHFDFFVPVAVGDTPSIVDDLSFYPEYGPSCWVAPVVAFDETMGKQLKLAQWHNRECAWLGGLYERGFDLNHQPRVLQEQLGSEGALFYPDLGSPTLEGPAVLAYDRVTESLYWSLDDANAGTVLKLTDKLSDS